MTQPSVLVCDEPTTLLDRRNTRRVAGLIADLFQQVILSTPDLELVADWERVILPVLARVVPDGPRAVSGSGDKTLRGWDLRSDQCLATLEGHTDGVYSVALFPDGTRAVSGSVDETLRVWDLLSGQCLAPLQGHWDGGYSEARSPGGPHAASGSGD